MFRELDFQNKVFNTLSYYLEQLADRKRNANKISKVKEENPDIDMPIPDFTEDAFDVVKKNARLPLSRHDIPFSPRSDSLGRPVPNVTLKVPTGGGKTWLAVKSASMILDKYLNQQNGFILWIVPNEAIYTQTLKHFKDREHPYRHALDLAAAGQVKILTKTDRLNANDVKTNLCVMVLMLQSSNRKNKDSLKMFRDRGDVHGFIPTEGEQDKHNQLMANISNLDAYDADILKHAHVKESLGNALRIIQPVVIVDEGHKAISDLAHDTLYDFNPSFVLELTATPKDVKPKKDKPGRYANVLVEITGKELNAEGMIKMPIILDAQETEDWKTVLGASVDRLKQLQLCASHYQAESNTYIRPILLVQVERTGKDQREGTHIHAEDVKDYLLKTGFNEKEVAIKTADQNDLKQPENQNLLSNLNQVRVIITKEALQEGWDCPFAYVLCSLAKRENLGAMTQLVGRILRQPNARKTEQQELDQCYVFTNRAKTRDLIELITKSLESEGLGDLALIVDSREDKGIDLKHEKIYRRSQFKKLEILLPRVLINRNGEMKPIDYQTDILPHIKWNDFDNTDVVSAIESYQPDNERQLTAVEIASSEDHKFSHHAISKRDTFNLFDHAQVVREINDIVLNPFIAWEIINNVVEKLKQNDNYDDHWLGLRSLRLTEELRRALLKKTDEKAQEYFKDEVSSGRIQFRLRTGEGNWAMPEYNTIIVPKNQKRLTKADGEPLQRSLFEKVYENELNTEECGVAIYLDRQKALGWWYRNVANRGYGLQGWKKNIIYPDFLFSISESENTKKLVALETKGEFLDGTEDTNYKKELMCYLTENFNIEKATQKGYLDLGYENIKMFCHLIVFKDYERVLSEKYFNDN
ncbi:DEAD/DEAH box helicase family protein [Alphaproteobacteria bacterium]|nr:DEAD/DEAH box helicase family protein [Alphaproteobacteria bacterium]